MWGSRRGKTYHLNTHPERSSAMPKMMYGRLAIAVSRMGNGVVFVVRCGGMGRGSRRGKHVIVSLTRREVVHADDVFWPLGDGRGRVCAFENV